ncbi:MAG TPA: hypothetical protein VGS27_34510 [Candidatus Sulfotelmatobacter sp.]|nr:hypothetical protein [Candidatus Sulfotelmatobacter sp.]
MKSEVNQSLERTLESAVIVSWADLIHEAQTGLIHIEYGFAPTGTLDYLKIWSSLTRGHWLLACEYWMSESTFHGAGVRFENGYESEGLSNILERVMQNQTSFVLPENMGRQGLLQISSPTEEDRSAACEWIRDTFDRLGSTLAEPALA